MILCRSAVTQGTFIPWQSRPRLRPRYTEGIWKRSFHSENVSNIFLQTKPEEFKNETITSHFGFELEENLGREITWLSLGHRYQKAPSSKCFLSTLRRKAGAFKFLWFEERFRKALFSWRISEDGMPNRRNKAAFSSSSGEVRTRPKVTSFFKKFTFFFFLTLGFVDNVAGEGVTASAVS